MNQPPVECSADGCTATLTLGLGTGDTSWTVIEGGAWCPLHRVEKERAVGKFEEWVAAREQIEEFRRKRNAFRAKKHLSRRDYRKWDEFQSDLVNFHRNHGKLAPRVLRTLDPLKFTAIVKERGKIDVEEVSNQLLEAESKADGTLSWLLHRL